MTKVVYVIDNLLHGGAQKFLLQLTEGLAARGYQQSVVCLNRADEKYLRHFEELGIPVRRYSPLQYLSQWACLGLTRMLQRERPDIVMTMLTFSDALGRTAARIAAVPVVVSAIRGHKPRWELLYSRFTSSWVTAYTVNARTLIAHTREGERCPDARVEEIWNGIPLQWFDPAGGDGLRQSLGLAPYDPLILCMGRLSEEKGQQVLIDAAPPILEEHGTARILFVGNGDRRFLEAKAAGHPRILFHDAVDDVRPFLAAADLLVIPSLHEAFPNVLLEGMAASLPVIASRYGAIPKILLEGETGWLVDPGDARGLATAVRAALRDPERSAAMGSAGRKRVEDQLSVDRMVEAYDRLFTELTEAVG